MKQLLFTIFLALSFLITQAQHSSFQAGASLNYLTAEADTANLHAPLSYYFGIHTRYGGKWNLSTAVNYVYRPLQIKIKDNNGAETGRTGEVNLHIIKLPLLLGYSIDPYDTFDVRVFLGMSIDLIVGGKNDELMIMDDDFNAGTLNIMAGINIHVTDNVYLEASYEKGIDKILDEGSNAKLDQIVLGIGYFLN